MRILSIATLNAIAAEFEPSQGILGKGSQEAMHFFRII